MMRTTMIEDTTILLVISCLALLFILSLATPIRPKMWVYPIVRYTAQAKVDFESRQMAVYETEHFRIKYTQVDADTVDMIAEAAEAAYRPVTRELHYTPYGKTLIVVQPTKNELRQAFGWAGNESAMGVYWGGAIQLLSPHAWLSSGESVEEFIHSGPMVHEYTHLVFDYLTNGNYPRWFTEGLAQYIEYRVNDYEWLTSVNHLDGKLYTMAELEGEFDQLPNQSLAYRQSLSIIRYIQEVYGEGVLQDIIMDLKTGQSLERSMEKRTDVNASTFESSWQEWAIKHMNNHHTEKQ